MKVKVCGLKHPDNIHQIAALGVDYLGLIFYDKSPRNAESLPPDAIIDLTQNVVFTGVFVNSPIDFIAQKVDLYGLKAVQLHGEEPADFIDELKKVLYNKVQVFKVFSVDNDFDFTLLQHFDSCIDYYLFDTKGKDKGGNGIKFNWKLLENNPHIQKPYFLSGGIAPDDAYIISTLSQTQKHLYGIDINSRFETLPGMKNVEMIQAFIKKIRGGVDSFF